MLNYVAQGLGLLSLILVLSSYLCNVKSKMLWFLFVANLACTLQFSLLGAVTSAVVCGIATVRVLAFLFIEENKWLLFIFMGATLIAGIVTYTTPIGLLSVIGSLFFNFSSWVKEPKKVRLFSMPGSVCWCLNDLVVGAIFSAISEMLALLSIFIGIHKHDKRKNEV